MPIYFGSDEPVDIRIGADAVKAVYVGSEKVWPVAVPQKPRRLVVADVNTSTFHTTFYAWNETDGQTTLLADYPVYPAGGFAVDGDTLYFLNPYDTSSGPTPMADTLMIIEDGVQSIVPITGAFPNYPCVIDGILYFLLTGTSTDQIQQAKDGVQSTFTGISIPAARGFLQISSDGAALYALSTIGGGTRSVDSWTSDGGQTTVVDGFSIMAESATSAGGVVYFTEVNDGSAYLDVVVAVDGNGTETSIPVSPGAGAGVGVPLGDAIYISSKTTATISGVDLNGQIASPFSGLTYPVGLAAG